MIGHQLKHPAAAVATIVNALRHNDTAQLDETSLHYIDLLKTENENQIRLIDNLLEAAPKTKKEIYSQRIDLAELLSKLAQRITRAHERFDIERFHGMAASGHAGGLGLGLYASYRVTKNHDGTLNIHTSDKLGTAVTIKLERSAPQ